MKRPILIALIGYIIGIIWELYFNINIAPFVILLIVIMILDRKHDKIFVLIIISMIISNIQINILNHKFDNLYNNLKSESKFIGTVISNKAEGDYLNTYTIKIYEVNKNNKVKGTKILLKTKSELSYGDRISFIGTYTKAETRRNYMGFDYSEYLKTIGIYGICDDVKEVKILNKNNLNIINLKFHSLSLKIKDKIFKFLDNKEANILIALITGDNTQISEEVKENFKNSGLYHILAISGMHMMYIVLILEKITDNTNINKNVKKIIQVIGIVLFVQLTTKSISILRASIMAILNIIAFIVRRKSDIINNLSISMLLILIFNPYSMENISFQLSFGGVIGIILLNNSYKKMLKNLKINEKIADSISSIMAAQTVIMPIMIINYHTISLTFIISNLLAGYIIGFIVVLGIVTTIISFLSIKVACIFAIPLSIFIKLLNLITIYGAFIPLSKIYISRPSIYVIIVYYIIILKLTVFKNICNKEINIFFEFIKHKKIYLISLIMIIIFTYSFIPKSLRIYFIDVGQGDSTLIITPYNKKILIDSGGSTTYDIGKKTLLPYLLNRGINLIDYAIISHFDTDHVRRVSICYGRNKSKECCYFKTSRKFL